jgi:tRNA dimethylallyltransferase
MDRRFGYGGGRYRKRMKVIIIIGPNASGKSGLGVSLAEKFGGEIISADSRQIYKGFDLCSGKISNEDRRGVPHHMLDILEPGKYFSVADFQKKTYQLIPEIYSRGKIPFIVGGTGLYAEAVAEGYDLSGNPPDYKLRAELEILTAEELRERLQNAGVILNESDSKNKRRLARALERLAVSGNALQSKNPSLDCLKLGILRPKDVLFNRIDERLDARIGEGMIGEVKEYLASGGGEEFLFNLGLEFRYILLHLKGEITDLRGELSKAVKKFAKRQITWFKRDKNIIWIENESEAEEKIKEFLQ